MPSIPHGRVSDVTVLLVVLFGLVLGGARSLGSLEPGAIAASTPDAANPGWDAVRRRPAAGLCSYPLLTIRCMTGLACFIADRRTTMANISTTRPGSPACAIRGPLDESFCVNGPA